MSCLLWNQHTPLSFTFPHIVFRSVPFVFGRGSAFCLNHECRMSLQPWIVCISEDVNRDNVRGINILWQCCHYTLGWEFVINNSQLLSWFLQFSVYYPLELCKGVSSYDDDIFGLLTERDVLTLPYQLFSWQYLYGFNGLRWNKAQSLCHNLFSRIRPNLVDGDVQEGVGKGECRQWRIRSAHVCWEWWAQSGLYKSGFFSGSVPL